MISRNVKLTRQVHPVRAEKKSVIPAITHADGTADVQMQVDRLIAECKVGGFDKAVRYLADNRAAVVEIAVKVRLEPKTRELPSPFVYSML